MIKNGVLLFNTLKYLKPVQIYYRGYYFVRKKLKKHYPFFLEANSHKIHFENKINSFCSYKDGTFTFLNLSKKFDDIDWNFKEFGKLWTYNLNYFDYLNQKEIKKEDGLRLVYDFIDNIKSIEDGFESYPISLRIINWIKFLSRFEIKDKKIDNSLYAQSRILYDNLEYHLLGNHLLENGFALFFAGYYFDDKKLLNKAKEILKYELNEQILDDGGHFELSPMYHQIIFYRLLDTINLIKSNETDDVLKFLEQKAALMNSWLKNITFSNGDIPLLNDSANKIAPTSKKLFEYFNNLKLKIQNLTLTSSGYRKITKNSYECIVDIGEIGAGYIPGHAHADTFNFVLYKNGKPFIVDTGISTYEENSDRYYERSTKAHNTVEVNNTDSSEVWGSFRVANRAHIIDAKEEKDFISAKHDGYKKFGILHTRSWRFFEDRIIITDKLSKKSKAVFRLHFHPNIDNVDIKNYIKTKKNYNIKKSYVAFEFNKKMDAYLLEIEFEKELKVEILI